MMVQAVRGGESVRSVARRFAVSPATVLKWVSRCEGRRLDRVNFEDRPRGAKVVWNRTAVADERRVLELRQHLRNNSLLGEFGAKAIHSELSTRGCHPVPCGGHHQPHPQTSWCTGRFPAAATACSADGMVPAKAGSP